jgi:PEP-CTERM motif
MVSVTPRRLLAGAAGVGIIGAYVADGAGNIAFASTQAQMNYLLAPVGGFAAPINNFTLTTPATFVTCVLCGPLPFWEAAFANPAPGSTVQLIGAINFTVNPGDSIVLPGSLLIEDDDNAAIQAELPEPGTVFLLGSALIGLGVLRKLH